MGSANRQCVARELTCHYCGTSYGNSERDSSKALRRHLRNDCPDVPEVIRLQYDRRCPAGRCNP